NNSFELPITLNDADFISLDQSLLSVPRNSDGSLPDIDFMRPVQRGVLEDAGVDIGFPFSGNAPDLGAIEIDYTTSIKTVEQIIPKKITLSQNYPNPFNTQTIIPYTLSEPGYIHLSIHNILGQKIHSLLAGQYQHAGDFSVSWNGAQYLGGSAASGIYFYRLSISNSSGSHTVQKKMMCLK
ncbi:MAG: T9SS type A sorting domain-containing protein, partial [Saprospiraceae bacterium]